MIEPKIFYRKLDSIQNQIGKQTTGKDFLFHIAKELENLLGKDLHLTNGVIYEKNEDEFILISNHDNRSTRIKENIAIESKSIQTLLQNKIYIYDSKEMTFEGWQDLNNEYTIPAALTVSSPENRWIILFELKDGWEREDVEFCLNAVRTALNYRLVSDSVKNDMEQAVQIQKSLLPQEAPEIKGLDIAGNSIPAELVGGDLYDYFDFGNDCLGFCVGDASGHGLPAALVARDAVTGLRMGLEKHMKMVHTLKKLNTVIYKSVYSSRFISLFYAELEQDGNLFYVNAGHPSPILVKDNTVEELDSTGLIFGALPEIDLRRSFTRMEKGSVLTLFSDGIIERSNNNGEDFSVKRLTNVIIENQKLPASEIRDKIFEEVFSFGNNCSWEDDVTVVVIKRL
ncbi:MAG: PP2C family protein-serine/threonine phosphatase [Melioribacteraceae bacterium]|nr:PP2C family protein-serine/threonine phosphatase [Melioribacteraceae bacterium]